MGVVVRNIIMLCMLVVDNSFVNVVKLHMRVVK